MPQENVSAHIDMSRSTNIALVRGLFEMRETAFLVMSTAQVIAQAAQSHALHGLPPETTQEDFDSSRAVSYQVLGKLWVALPVEVRLKLKQQVLECFNLEMEVELAPEVPAVPVPGETI